MSVPLYGLTLSRRFFLNNGEEAFHSFGPFAPGHLIDRMFLGVMSNTAGTSVELQAALLSDPATSQAEFDAGLQLFEVDPISASRSLQMFVANRNNVWPVSLFRVMSGSLPFLVFRVEADAGTIQGYTTVEIGSQLLVNALSS